MRRWLAAGGVVIGTNLSAWPRAIAPHLASRTTKSSPLPLDSFLLPSSLKFRSRSTSGTSTRTAMSTTSTTAAADAAGAGAVLKQTLPLKDYFSTLAYLSFLLSTTIALLPRSTGYFYPGAVKAQTTSADRPEHPFLTPITANPAASAAWIAAGTGVTVAWLGNRFARWVGKRGVSANPSHATCFCIHCPLFLASRLLGPPASGTLEA